MQATIIYDNHSSNPDFLFGWGFSCLIDQRILFDTGEAPEPLIANLKRHGISLGDIDAVVISHEHWDHINGLWELLQRRPGLTVYACPGFSDTFKQQVGQLNGTLVETGSPTKLDDTIATTGEIPSLYKGDPMPEQALTVKTAQGVSIITGCSHPGILTMIQTARDIHPDATIQLVMGGFHLMNTEPEAILSIASSMKELDIKAVAPTHCSGDTARQIFQKSFGDRYIPVGAGSTVEIP